MKNVIRMALLATLLGGVALLLLGSDEEYFVEYSELEGQYDLVLMNHRMGSVGFRVGDVFVENNTWNRGDIDINDFAQIVFSNEDGTEIGWTWTWPLVMPLDVRAYPEVVVGKKPWQDTSTSAELPARIGDVTSFRLWFEIESTSTGQNNTAFDIWITNDPRCAPGDIVLELMIWLESNGMLFREEDGRAYIGGQFYPFWYLETMHHADWQYARFVVGHKRSIDIMPYIRYLISLGHLSKDHYLASVRTRQRGHAWHGTHCGEESRVARAVGA